MMSKGFTKPNFWYGSVSFKVQLATPAVNAIKKTKRRRSDFMIAHIAH